MRRFDPAIPLVVVALAALTLIACAQPNRTGGRVHDGGDAMPTPPIADAAAGDLAAPVDAATQPPDVIPTECTPRAIGCSPDGRSMQTCDEQGRWTFTAMCAAQTECSGGVCLCSPGVCDEGSIYQVATMPGLGFVTDLAAGNGALFLAIGGTQSSIRRFDVQNKIESVVHMGGSDLSLYALDVDPAGILTWCSWVRAAAGYLTGEVTSGNAPLETGLCTYVRRRDNLVYYLSNGLYRVGLDGSERHMVSSEAMKAFAIAGDSIYFVGPVEQASALRRASLSDFTRVDTIASGPDPMLRLIVDATHVYWTAGASIMSVAQAAGGQPDTFWQDRTAEVWALAQTESHVYWSTTTASATTCNQAQVWRRPKLGGPAAILSTMPGRCAGELVVLGQYLYASVGVTPPGAAPTDVLRIKL
jgi:hypothetical protein